MQLLVGQKMFTVFIFLNYFYETEVMYLIIQSVLGPQ